MIQRIKCFFGHHERSEDRYICVITAPFRIEVCPACGTIRKFIDSTGKEYASYTAWANEQPRE